MKKSRLLSLIAILGIVFFFSCENEPIDPALFNTPPTSDCASPSSLTVSNFINGNSVNLSWPATVVGNTYEIQYGTTGFVLGTGTSLVVTTANTTITGLVSTTNYQFYIRTICASNLYSSWVGPVATGSTAIVCFIPSNLNAVRSLTTPTQVTVNWAANGDETSWQIQYGAAGFTLGSGTTVTSQTTTKTINSLLTTSGYDFYVRSNCSATETSDWAGPISVASVTGTICSAPTSLSAVRNPTLTTQATLNWTAGGAETSWEIQYGTTGFNIGTGTIVNTTTKPKTISGLLTSSYDFYVRAKCSATENSSWVGPYTISSVQAIDNTPALMTAFIESNQYNYMVPYQYSFIPTDIHVMNNGAPVGDPRYIWIQGVTTDNLSTIKEIDLYIPTFQWAPGTYSLTERAGFDGYNFSQVYFLTNSGSNTITNNISGGTITVTEFNLTTKRIKGTFSFSYEKIINGVSTGTFDVTNGTFNYGLDDPYFN